VCARADSHQLAGERRGAVRFERELETLESEHCAAGVATGGPHDLTVASQRSLRDRSPTARISVIAIAAQRQRSTQNLAETPNQPSCFSASQRVLRCTS
jgi:hypothetical protein